MFIDIRASATETDFGVPRRRRRWNLRICVDRSSFLSGKAFRAKRGKFVVDRSSSLSGKAFREAPKAESKPAAGGNFWGFRAHEDSNPFTENAFHDGKSLENPKKFPPAAGNSLS